MQFFKFQDRIKVVMSDPSLHKQVIIELANIISRLVTINKIYMNRKLKMITNYVNVLKTNAIP